MHRLPVRSNHIAAVRRCTQRRWCHLLPTASLGPTEDVVPGVILGPEERQFLPIQ